MSKVVNLRLSLEGLTCDPSVCRKCDGPRGECIVNVSTTVMTLWEEGNLLDHVEATRFEERKCLYTLAKRWLSEEAIDVSINAVAVDVFDNEFDEVLPLITAAERLQAMIDRTDELMKQEQAKGPAIDFGTYAQLRDSKKWLVDAYKNRVYTIYTSV